MRPAKNGQASQASAKAAKPVVVLPPPHSKDLVWAKVPTWPWWPARVLEQRSVKKEDGTQHDINIVLFFVDNTIGEVSGALLPFHEHYDRFKDFDYSNKKLMHAIEEARAVLLDAKLNEAPSSAKPAPAQKARALRHNSKQLAAQQQAASLAARHPPGEEVALPPPETAGGGGGPMLPFPLPVKEDCAKGSKQLLRWLRQAALEPEVSRNKLNDQSCKRMLHAIRHNQQAVEGVELVRMSTNPTSAAPREAWPPATGLASPSAALASDVAAATNGEQVRCSKRMRKPQPWLAQVAEEIHLPSLMQPNGASVAARCTSSGRTVLQRQASLVGGLQSRYSRMQVAETGSRAVSSGSSKRQQQQQQLSRQGEAAAAGRDDAHQCARSWQAYRLQRRRPATARDEEAEAYEEDEEVLLIEQGQSPSAGARRKAEAAPLLAATKRARLRAASGATSSGDARESGTALENDDACGYSLGEDDDDDDDAYMAVGGSPPEAERLLQRCSSLLALTLPLGGAGMAHSDDGEELEEDVLASAHGQQRMVYDDACHLSGVSDDEGCDGERPSCTRTSMSEDGCARPNGNDGAASDAEGMAVERPGAFAGLHGLLDDERIVTDMAHAADLFGALALGGPGGRALLGTSPTRAWRLPMHANARGSKGMLHAATEAATVEAAAGVEDACASGQERAEAAGKGSDADTDCDVGAAAGPSGDVLEGEDSDSPTTTVAALEMLIDGWQPDVDKAGPTDPELEAEMQRAASGIDGRLRLRSCSGSDSVSHLIKIAEICGRDTDGDGFGTDDSELKDDGGGGIGTDATAANSSHGSRRCESTAVLALRAALDTTRHELQCVRGQLASSREEAARQRQLREERDKVLERVVGELRSMRPQLRTLQKQAATKQQQQQAQQQALQVATPGLQAALDALAPISLAAQQQQLQQQVVAQQHAALQQHAAMQEQAIMQQPAQLQQPQASAPQPAQAQPPVAPQEPPQPCASPSGSDPATAAAAAAAAAAVSAGSKDEAVTLRHALAEAQAALVEAHNRQTLLIQRQQSEVQQLRVWLQAADAEGAALRRDNEQLRRTFLDGRASGVHIASTVLTALMASPKLTAKEKERLSGEMNSLLVQLVGKAS